MIGDFKDRLSYWHIFVRMWVLWLKGDTKQLDKYLYAMMSRSFEHNDMFTEEVNGLTDNRILIKLTDWKLWIIIAFVPCIVSLGVSLHDVSIDANKAHSDWYNAWKGGIATATDCKWLNGVIEDEKGHWVHSELYPLVEKRLGEIKC